MFYFQDPASGENDWNGVAATSQLELEPATSDSPGCCQKENSADPGDPVDPVAKAIEQRSYR